jgi:hypothetical protein
MIYNIFLIAMVRGSYCYFAASKFHHSLEHNCRFASLWDLCM